MNIKEVKEIIELMKENNLTEFEMERDGLRISLRRGHPGQGQDLVTVAQTPIAVAPAVTVAAAAGKTEEGQGEESQPDNIVKIESPIVGTFYSSPSPDAAAYVFVGQEIEPNDVVCIVEAMKVMNEIKAEVRGKVKEILVKNGEPIEYGQPLFVVEKH